MPVFDFDQVDKYVQSNANSIEFFKLQDDQWSAKVRFMYGPNETFQGQMVHNVSNDPKKPKYVPCIRELNQSLDACPLCKAGNSVKPQFYIPLYVISMTKIINGVTQPEETINKVMIFQRGKTFQGSFKAAIRQSQGSPLVNCVFNIIRNGKANDQGTNYMVELISKDTTTLETLPPKPQILGSPILPSLSYDELLKYVNTPQDVVPRTSYNNSAYMNNSTTNTNVPF